MFVSWTDLKNFLLTSINQNVSVLPRKYCSGCLSHFSTKIIRSTFQNLLISLLKFSSKCTKNFYNNVAYKIHLLWSKMI